MINLETDLRSIQITSKTGETASYVYACYTHSLFNKAHNGLDPSWPPLRTNGSVALSFQPPLLRRPVEVSRETV